MTQSGATQRSSEQADAIRPFHVNVAESDLIELRKRINATKWPERETVTDATQGVQLATIQRPGFLRHGNSPNIRRRSSRGLPITAVGFSKKEAL